VIAGLAAVFGLLIGSFLNVVIYRVPQRMSVAWPASHCPVCRAPISPRDNIPVISYVLLGGKCRRCKARIPLRYPAVELLTAVLFGAAGYRFGIGVRLLESLVLISILIVLAATDLDHRLLPNAIVGPAAAVGFALSVVGNPSGWWVYLLSAAGIAGALLALALAYPGGMGMGDVKMGGMLGAFLGPYAALAVFVGALCGALVGGGLMLAGRAGRRSALPFGVFMAFGGLVALFGGREIWDSYLGLVAGA
jgi:leader peptidase (prepilin peptidase)/N-methyltransferase